MGCLTLVFKQLLNMFLSQRISPAHSQKWRLCAGRVMPEYNRGLSRQISVCLQTSSLKITHVDKHVGMAHHWLSQNWMLKVQIPNKHSQTAGTKLGYLKMWWSKSKSTLKHMYTSNTSKNWGFHGCKFGLTPKCVEGRRVWRTLMLWMTVLLRILESGWKLVGSHAHNQSNNWIYVQTKSWTGKHTPVLAVFFALNSWRTPILAEF